MLNALEGINILGKMKGNRLNTAANVGSLVTGRQQLKVQRQIASQGAAQTQIAAAQLAVLQEMQLAALKVQQDKEFRRVKKWVRGEVAAERMGETAAELHIERFRINQLHEQPTSQARVKTNLSRRIDTALGGGANRLGWYKEPSGEARWWDGSEWTLRTMPVSDALSLVVNESISYSAGWYLDAKTGLSKFWDGRGWTGETRPRSQAVESELTPDITVADVSVENQEPNHLQDRVPESTEIEISETIEFDQSLLNSNHRIQKSRLIAGLLGIFLGFIGIHRYYLGYKGVFAWQVILFVLLGITTLGLIGAWGVFEGILILIGVKYFQKDGRGVPLRR